AGHHVADGGLPLRVERAVADGDAHALARGAVDALVLQEAPAVLDHREQEEDEDREEDRRLDGGDPAPRVPPHTCRALQIQEAPAARTVPAEIARPYGIFSPSSTVGSARATSRRASESFPPP